MARRQRMIGSAKRSQQVTASSIPVRAGHCKVCAETLCHTIKSGRIRQEDRTLLTNLRVKLSYVDACQLRRSHAVTWPADAATLAAASCGDTAPRRGHAGGRILHSQRRQRHGASQQAAAGGSERTR